MTRKYLLDENIYTAMGQVAPSNFHNLKDIIRIEGIPITGKRIHDSTVLDISLKYNYTLITRDKGLAMRAMIKGKDVVYCTLEGIFFIKSSNIKRLDSLDKLR